MANVEHPNIVPVHELGLRDDGSLYFTMKEVKGVTLADVLRQLRIGSASARQRWPLSALVDIFQQVCHAVDFAHSRGVIHRDLKPANILIGDYGEVMVLDWGLAKFFRSAPTVEEPPGPDAEPVALSGADTAVVDLPTRGQTMEGAVAGTPDYMAPEQAEGKVSAHDERTDIYALGGILYELLTLQGTIQKIQIDDILKEVASSEIIPPRRALKKRADRKALDRTHIPRELDAICMTALAKRREDRYGSVGDLVRDINAWRNHLPVSVSPDPLPVKVRKWCARHPVLSASLFSALLALLVAAVALGVARTVRFSTLVESAHEHRERGTTLFADNVVLLLKDSAAGPGSTRDERSRGLRQEMETEYQVATVLYSQAVAYARGPVLRPYIREIFYNRLRLAMLADDRGEARQWLDFLRAWFGQDFEEAEPDGRAMLQAMAGWAEGDDTQRGAALVEFTQEEMAYLRERGVEL
jgi:serine/threonine protein kinase